MSSGTPGRDDEGSLIRRGAASTGNYHYEPLPYKIRKSTQLPCNTTPSHEKQSAQSQICATPPTARRSREKMRTEPGRRARAVHQLKNDRSGRRS